VAASGLKQLRVQMNLGAGQGFRHGTVLFGVLRMFLEDHIIDARNVGLSRQLNPGDGKCFADLFEYRQLVRRAANEALAHFDTQ